MNRGDLRCPHIEKDEQRCRQCPLNWLDEALSSEAGRLARHALRIDRAIQVGITYGPGDVTEREIVALWKLERERDTLQREREKQPPNATVPNKDQQGTF